MRPFKRHRSAWAAVLGLIFPAAWVFAAAPASAPRGLRFHALPAASGTVGVWEKVTPPSVDAVLSAPGNTNYGTEAVAVDPFHPETLYTYFMDLGVWKSSDYGLTWTGPINTGANGSTVQHCSGGITVAPGTSGNTVVYMACIPSAATGFWKSVDGGVNWTQYAVSVVARQDYYPPVVDPYDPLHLLMPGHEMDVLAQSIDGGQTWSAVNLDPAMKHGDVGTGAIIFVDMGNAAATRTTWLWQGQNGNDTGVWRTTNGGTSWANVELTHVHPHGLWQVHQPGGGVIYLPGINSAKGNGLLRSTDYGVNWTHVGGDIYEEAVVATSNKLYAMYSVAFLNGWAPNLQVSADLTGNAWTTPATPMEMNNGFARAAVTSDGVHNIIVGAHFANGLWRYVEPYTPPPATGTPGVWENVTPAAIDLVNDPGCGNYGVKTVQVDPLRPQDAYASFNCQGLWKSTDYGATWSGPVNTGTNGAAVGNCAAGIALGPNGAGNPPIIYEACIRGDAVGFSRSLDGGVNWTFHNVSPAPPGASGQQFYAPAVDPYDGQHLLMAGHANDILVQSIDGGQNWTAVHIEAGMASPGSTGGINFINTGDPATTRITWLWMSAQTGGGSVGTWRTVNGSTWTKVDANEHVNGSTHGEFFQRGSGGVMYMAGVYSANGWGVQRSADYGVTWSHVGGGGQEAVVVGTAKNVYAMYGWGIGPGGDVDPNLETAAQPGTGSWTAPGRPAGMTQGPAQAAVTSDGAHSIIMTANYNAGLWRYVEP
jgi:hypothetical protein